MRFAVRPLAVVLASLALAAQTAPAPRSAAAPKPASALASQPAGALSERVVAYNIDAKYDPKSHELNATERLTYRNLTGEPQTTFPFHLYLNAFQPQSTFATEEHRDSPQLPWEEKYRAGIDIKRISANGADVTSTMKFIQPDDNNPNDKTVMQVSLPKAVAPGENVTFDINFHDKFGEVVARTGYAEDFTLGGQWFPKVGVWWHDAWNCHQFHATTEFFADFGTFDVRLTVPENQVVGASGVQTNEQKNSDGTKTLSFHGQDIHDFAWTSSPSTKLFEDAYTGANGPVKLRLLMRPEHADQHERTAAILKNTMALYEKWYGVYPYPQLTYVDPASQRAGGMEYPMFITGDAIKPSPEWQKFFPEVVAEHEFGHQYWYGMVATNEFEEAWLDEGINSYVEVKVMDALFGQRTSLINLNGAWAGDRDMLRYEYITTAEDDPMTRRAYQFMTGNAYGGITYGKTATVLLTLEGIVGEDTVQRGVRTWFERYRFKHPTGDDFMRTMEEVAGRDLKWYFDQAIRGTEKLDYEVSRVRTGPAEWWKDSSGGEFTSEVLLHRKGDFIMPVTVEVVFENGERKRETWDGKDRWMRYVYHTRSRLRSAEIDPDHKVWLDTDIGNNSQTLQRGSAATHKLQNYWLFAVQWLEQAVSWLA